MSRTFETFMDRVTALPANPTVSVIINGLGLLCFSRLNHGRAEVGFLKTKSRHPMIVTIYDNCCNVYKSFPELECGEEIIINSNNPGIGQLYTPDIYETPDDSIDADFRHLLNIDEMHKLFNRVNVQIKPGSTYQAKLFISKGIFYNAQRSTYAARIRHRNGSIRFPKIGKSIGANIMDSQVLVSVGSETCTLTNDNKSPYTISIRYKCNARARAETDFERFHRILELNPNEFLDVAYNRVEPIDKLPCESKFEKAFSERSLREEFLKDKALITLFRSLSRAEEACQTSTKPECPNNLRGVREPCL